MKKILILVTILIVSANYAQETSFLTIEKTLQNYINGSSYNNIKLLESAFTENATLYLTGKDGFKRYSPKEYANFFKNKKSGEFNGRIGKVLAIDVYKDIATAKVSIAIASVKAIYIDLFLLKKTASGWKIISKTATKMDEN